MGNWPVGKKIYFVSKIDQVQKILQGRLSVRSTTACGMCPIFASKCCLFFFVIFVGSVFVLWVLDLWWQNLYFASTIDQVPKILQRRPSVPSTTACGMCQIFASKCCSIFFMKFVGSVFVLWVLDWWRRNLSFVSRIDQVEKILQGLGQTMHSPHNSS